MYTRTYGGFVTRFFIARRVVVDEHSNLFKCITEIAAPLGLRVIEVRYNVQHSRLSIVVYRKNMTIADCETLNRALLRDPDLIQETSDNISIEVSSPGINRNLKELFEYDIFSGRAVRIVMHTQPGEDGVHMGIIHGTENDMVILKENGTTISIPFEKIARGRLIDDDAVSPEKGA